MAATIIGWILGIIFIVVGILNVVLVHPVPGLFYLLFSVIFLPPVNAALRRRFGFAVPFTLQTVVGIIVLWGTLAVGDLAEVLGF